MVGRSWWCAWRRVLHTVITHGSPQPRNRNSCYLTLLDVTGAQGESNYGMESACKRRRGLAEGIARDDGARSNPGGWLLMDDYLWLMADG